MLVTPISCRCRTEVTYDPAKPGEYQFVATLERCDAHQAIPDDQILDVLFGPRGECRTQTSLVNVLMKDEIGLAELDANGQKTLREDVQFSCWFEGDAPNRTLKYVLSGDAVDAKKLEDVAAAIAVVAPPDTVENVDVAIGVDVGAEVEP